MIQNKEGGSVYLLNSPGVMFKLSTRQPAIITFVYKWENKHSNREKNRNQLPTAQLF